MIRVTFLIRRVIPMNNLSNDWEMIRKSQTSYRKPIISYLKRLIFSLKLTDVKTCQFNPLNYDDIEAKRVKFI